MDEKQYQRLCEACDRVLLAQDSTIERVAIPWLHIIREHPVFLVKYAELFEPAKDGRAIGYQLWWALRNRARWFRHLGKALCSDGQPWSGQNEFPQEIDVLFVSHFLNASHAGQADDFYFGQLPNELIAQGHSVVIALINHTGLPGAALVDKWKESAVPRIIFSRSFGIAKEITLCRRIKKESLRLKALARKETAGLFRKVLARASQEALSDGSRTTLRMFEQIGILAARLKPKVIAITHEGHAWERIAFAAARSAVPEVRCIGYQHAALFRLQHAIRRSLRHEYNPDQILTAGEVGRAQLERAPGLEGIPVSVLGSNRSAKSAGIHGGWTAAQAQAADPGNLACLVLPEGIASECYLLFEFSLACAQAFPEIQFIWRLHPVVTYESLFAQDSKLKTIPRNIVLSKATLDEDIARSRWTLYRGTTAVVQAAVAGLRPIYLSLPGELTIDPLYELGCWRARIVTISDFRRVIDSDSSASVSFSRPAMQSAKRYCESFFMPLELYSMSRIISERV